MWCRSCAKNVPPKNMDGKICCPICGRVLEEDNFSQEPTFVKNAAGQSQLSGNFVRTIQNEYSVSRERILDEAYRGIEGMMYSMAIDGGDSISRPALAFYRIAVERNFTRGRRKEQVEAACLYIACRENKKPFLLIDFSEHLRINVYVLGAVFLQLCKLLSLEEHPIVQKPVDPSLFIHRFSDRLFGSKKPGVSRTALHIVASMKRDWMQTGRKPSGLCGAALYIACLSHGLTCSKNEIIKVVHICETTLTKRLIEFENTESGGLTIEEFNMKAEEIEKEERLSTSVKAGAKKESGINDLLCEHKGSKMPPFAHGLCRSCYEDFMKLSGGLDGGLEPPAFQRAEMERIRAQEAVAERSDDLESSMQLDQSDEQRITNNTNGSNIPQPGESGRTVPGANSEQANIGDSNNGRHTDDATFEDSDTLSDIDDIEEQAAKEAAARAAKEAYEAAFANCSEDVEAARKVAAAAAAAVAKSKKEKQQKRAAELKSSSPAQTAAEATGKMLKRKGLSARISYEALEKLFDEPEDMVKTKKSRKSEAEDDGEGDNDRHTNFTSKGEEEEQPEMDDDDDTYTNHNVEQEFEGFGYDDHNLVDDFF